MIIKESNAEHRTFSLLLNLMAFLCSDCGLIRLVLTRIQPSIQKKCYLIVETESKSRFLLNTVSDWMAGSRVNIKH